MRSRWLFALTLPAVGLLPVVGAADAASCKAMTVGYAFSSGNVVALEPQHVDIAYGGCVQFTNNVDLDVTITVAGGYSVTLGPKESTPPKDAYVGRTTGRHGVTARSGPSSADGSITVGSAPPPPRSASPTTTPPPPQHTASPTGQPAPAPAPSSSATGPRVAPVPPTAASALHHVHVPSPPGSVPSVAPTPPEVTATPLPSQRPSAPAVVAFPVEPPSSRGTGLPGAVAALAVVGTGAGLVRVLLAEPLEAVDDAERGVGGAA